MNYYNYFTEIEEHFVRRRGKHMWVSPMDWALVATWRDSGVPLNVALRGIDIAMDHFFASPHHRRYVSTLFYCHDAVLQEYGRFLESRVGDSSTDNNGRKKPASGAEAPENEDGGPDRATVLKFFSSKISEICGLREKHSVEEGAQLRQGLERIAGRLEEIARALRENPAPDYEGMERDLALLDAALVSELSPFVAREEMENWKQEAKKELKIYRKRLPKDTYLKIHDNFLRKKIHQRFGVGELSLFHL
jgi:hypothetical protein